MFNPDDNALAPLRYACTEPAKFTLDLEACMLAVQVACQFGATVEAAVPVVATALADTIQAKLQASSSSLYSVSSSDASTMHARHRQILLLRNIASRAEQAA